MQVDATHNAQIGFMIFDSWLKAVEKRLHANNNQGISAPAVDAAFQAFNAYASTVETMNNAQVAAVSSQLSGYAPNSTGGCSPTNTNIAPFLALNLMA